MIQAYAATEAGGTLEAFEYDPGELAASDVEIEIASCGICHSDLSMWKNDWGTTTYPFVGGHEVIGSITQVGEQVTHLKVGQKVGLGWHAGYCMTCSSCMSGDHNMCAKQSGTIVGRHGGFADKVRAQAASVLPLPEGVDLVSAGPLFCGGSTVFNPFVQFDISPTSRVGVIGIGGLGHMALMFANAWGCEVTAFTSSEAKMEEAKKLGAHKTVNSRDPDAIKAVRRHFDLIISTVNVKLDWGAYIGALRQRGRLHFVGAVPEPLGVYVFSMLGGQKTISSSPVGAPATTATMLEFVARHNIKPMIETFSFGRINDAVDRLANGKPHYRVVLTR